MTGATAWLAVCAGSLVLFYILIVAAMAGVLAGDTPFRAVMSLPVLSLYPVLGWIGWRSSGSVIGATLPPVVLGLLPPALMNLVADRQAASYIAGDAPFVPIIERPRSIAILGRRGGSSEDPAACETLCQRLLYGAGVAEVIMGGELDSNRTAPEVKRVRYRIERRQSCPAATVPDAGAISGEHQRWRNSVSTAVRLRIAEGECLIAEPIGSIAPDILWIERDLTRSTVQPSLLEPRLFRMELLRRTSAGYVTHGRHTRVDRRRAAFPFSGGASLAGFFLRSTTADDPRPFPATPLQSVLRPWLVAPAGVPDPRMRELVDDALDRPAPAGDPALPETAREQLFWAYLDRMAEKETAAERSDGERLARILAEPSFLPQRRAREIGATLGQALENSPAPRLAGDAILRRALQIDLNKDQALLSALSEALDWLPRNTYEAPSPLLEQLVAEPRRRGRMPAAVGRLADQGAQAAPALLAILAHDLPRRREWNAYPGVGESARRGVRALCRIAPVTGPRWSQSTLDLVRFLPPESGSGDADLRRQIERAAAVMAGAEPRRTTEGGRQYDTC
ncbi:MAG: hypothetical protein ACK40O_05500 [Allosphingosinicella sp.]